jgi:glycosyltransferase involved in cell wall biosynthesis
MKVLQLCKKFPFPLKDGESIAVTYLSSAMNHIGCEVSLLAMNTKKHYFDLANLPKSFNHYNKIWSVYVDNKINPLEAFANLFSTQSYHIQRFISDDFSKKLIEVLKENSFDVIQLETLYLTPYIDIIRQYSDAKIVLRSHNVEFEIWERLTANEANPIKKKYLSHLTKKLRNFEISQLSKVDAILAITERDLEKYHSYGFENEGIIVPIGLELSAYTPTFESFDKPLSISFIGSLDWQPNLEGLSWFLKETWPVLHNAFPDLEFHIAGRNTPDEIKNLGLNQVFVHGEVPDAQNFISEHSLMLVPLLSGGGMRAKILEGMALGKIVLSTTIGIEGIPVTNGEHAYIANTTEEFRAAIYYCYAQNGELKMMGQNARNFIQENYCNIQMAEKVLQFYYEICEIKMPNTIKASSLVE